MPNDDSIAIGLARPRPAMSGAEPDEVVAGEAPEAGGPEPLPFDDGSGYGADWRPDDPDNVL